MKSVLSIHCAMFLLSFIFSKRTVTTAPIIWWRLEWNEMMMNRS